MTLSPAKIFDEAQHLDHSGQKDLARQAYRRYLELQPGDANAWAQYGGLLLDMNQWDAAATACDQALLLDQDNYAALVHSACVLMQQDQLAAAETRFRRAISLDPARLGARLTLADCLIKGGDLAQARSLLDGIVAEFPDHPAALNRLSTLFVLQQDWPNLRRDLERQVTSVAGPEQPYRRSHLSLLFGDMPLGWQQFEARLNIPGRILAERCFPQPRWNGEPFVGKTLLLNWEQGFGDTLMFIRYAPMVKALGGRVVVEVQPPVAELVRTCPGIDEVVPQGSPLPPFDFHLPLLSLPALLHTSLASIPAEIPYLDIPASVPNQPWLSEALAPATGRLRVGVVWAGSSLHQRNAKRSMPAQSLAPLANWEGVAWYSFQLDTEALPPLPGIVSLAPLLSDFTDTAYALSGMDLVITVDTAIAHLAGALGIPTWLMLSFIPDWRWLLGRDDSPWYPSLRLFRQSRPGDWDSIVRQMAALVTTPT